MATVATSTKGPKGSLLLGNLAELQKDWLGTLSAWQEEYGDFVPVRLGPRPAAFIFHPDDAASILIDKNKHFRKNFIIRRTRPLLGDGLVLSEGSFWLRQRRLMQPAFHRVRIDLYAEIMAERTKARLDAWKVGESLDIHAEMMNLTRSIVSRSLFGNDVEDDEAGIAAEIDRMVAEFTKLMDSPFLVPLFIPTSTNIRFRKGKERLDQVVYRFIDERRKDPSPREDLMSMLLAAQDEDGSRMTEKQVRDEVITLFLAGHETTAVALTWAFYCLINHPEAAARLAQEVDDVLGDRLPSFEDVPKLKYAEAVVNESMRLYPPTWLMGRESIEACEIGGRTIPKGWNLLISPWVIHRDERWFEAAGEFRPERWETDLQSPRCAFMPFGAGPRMCIGKHFTMMEAVIILAMVAQRFHLRRETPEPVVPVPLISLRPKGGLMVSIHRR